MQLILTALFVFATLNYGAVHVWAQTVVFAATMGLAGGVLLKSALSRSRSRRRDSRRAWPMLSPAVLGEPWAIFLLLFAGMVLLQLTPLPWALLEKASPLTADLYRQADEAAVFAGSRPAGGFTGFLSLDRDKTVQALVTLFSHFAFAFLAARTVRTPRDLRRFGGLLLAFSVALALYGSVTVFFESARQGASREALQLSSRVAGTLVNPDHFATYLMLAVCLALGLLCAHLKAVDPPAGRTRAQRLKRLIASEDSPLPKAMVLLFTAAVLTFVLFYTLSRGAVIGLAAALLTGTLLLFARTRRPVFLLFMVPPALLITYYISSIGADPLLERIEQTRRELFELDRNTRTIFNLAGLELWGKFPWFGAGLGTTEVIAGMGNFGSVQDQYIPYLHNEWLQLAVETGWLGGGCFLLATLSLMAAFTRRWWRTDHPYGFGMGLAGVGVIVGLAVHGLVDFALRVPCNAMFVAVMLALAWVSLSEASGKASVPGETSRKADPSRMLRASVLLAAAVSLVGAWQAVRFGLADHYCPVSIDTMNREERVQPTPDRVLRALRHNPLNAEYWLNLGNLLEAEEAGEAEGAGDGEEPAGVPAVRKLLAEMSGPWSGEMPFTAGWAYGMAVVRSPADAGLWVVLGGFFQGMAEEGGGGAKDWADRAAHCFRLAGDLNPATPMIQRRVSGFAVWYWGFLEGLGVGREAAAEAKVLRLLGDSAGRVLKVDPKAAKGLREEWTAAKLPEAWIREILGEAP